MDIFTVDWVLILIGVPPLHLIAHALQHAKAYKAKGTLSFPAWKSAYYWPITCPDDCHLADFIHKWRYLAFSPELLLKKWLLIGGCTDGKLCVHEHDFSILPREFSVMDSVQRILYRGFF